MQRSKLIVVLFIFTYVLQVAVIVFFFCFLDDMPKADDILFCVLLSLATAGIEIGAARHLLKTLDRTSGAYAASVNAELARILEGYRQESKQEEERARGIALEVESELALARTSLQEGNLEVLNQHLYSGLQAASCTDSVACNNVVVAAVLESKGRQCENAGVEFEHKVSLPEDLAMEDTELASIFFNLIDNALNECTALMASDEADAEKSMSPKIVVRSLVQAEQLFVEVRNSCRADARARWRAVAYQDDGTRLHGLGTGIVRDIAKRHGGIVNFVQEDDEFVASVLIPLQQDEA